MGKRGKKPKPSSALYHDDCVIIPRPGKKWWPKVKRLQPIKENLMVALEGLDRFFGYMEGGKPLL